MQNIAAPKLIKVAKTISSPLPFITFSSQRKPTPSSQNYTFKLCEIKKAIDNIVASPSAPKEVVISSLILNMFTKNDMRFDVAMYV
ncbi:hypothetical protein MJO28_012145 [Puccinia striiformis f. sp. tritici]|uniref:Uncharacterized protein n=1 Tax=Puccinia striiformis f. sp. tritici TaxID=168172 RepID=A0ACC0E113_9BASI|nr:hypothetical protein MJO28_012145 [Puccinia striiformis f. sp. tritici]